MSESALTVDEIFERAQASLPENSLFASFRKEFTDRTEEQCGNSAGWINQKLSERQAAAFLQSVIGILEETSINLAHTTDDSVYGEATQIAQTIQHICAEVYDFQECTIRIMSPTRRMEAAGLAKVSTGKDGQLYIQPATKPLK